MLLESAYTVRERSYTKYIKNTGVLTSSTNNRFMKNAVQLQPGQ